MDSDFSSRLKALRQARNLSQEELAKRLGVSQGSVGNWESGFSTPPMRKMGVIADALGVAVTVLFPLDQASPFSKSTLVLRDVGEALWGGLPAGAGRPNFQDCRDFLEHILAATRGNAGRVGWVLEILKAAFRAQSDVLDGWKREDQSSQPMERIELPGGVNSESVSRAAEVGLKAGVEAVRSLRESEPSPKAGVPSAGKAGPKPGIRKH